MSHRAKVRDIAILSFRNEINSKTVFCSHSSYVGLILKWFSDLKHKNGTKRKGKKKSRNF